MDQVRLGNATLTRVIEWQVDDLPTAVFPHTPAQAWREHADEFAPTFWTDAGWRIALQVWVIEVDGLTVLVDTGAGNGKARPRMAVLDNLQTDFLQTLRNAGFDPGVVDVVVNTHLHFDHVGWNTMRDGDDWVPTFPNARYLVPEADYRHFAPDGPAQTSTPRTEDEESAQRHVRTVFGDSVSPVDDQIELWSDDHQLSESLWLRPAPGHTPGSSVVWLDAGKPAVFVGDLTHCPIQIARPGDPCGWDEDFEAAAVTRRRILTEASRRRAAVIPAHYPGHGGARVVARGDAFQVDGWLELPPI
ncbi:MBL fold metallo-hydrolase [Mycolicibacterium holsaticum]|uniref:MBL fold metallo-hydrolase n=1 Tax=Mycolicibacterium holsaticum TaxID=152142 RepID=A0A1E3R4D3_9MYCO|nr:MBL fold metallo-hydrolase [Mycolicibacterium holsaticum]MDA4108289.1 beta-lactamase [Mycolicibacterium holsaticum DSM 44478 = JCM 12374]ODQ84739.1 MBL fold metallo-hydrolase [Mycolicibacterium holsaticum]QZA12941.1 MBL fold metallo-hydrolase [Mycolicibacterium holsaticum DSM 44478 = JCM 12374]UNC09585.1 MBL fold metallo-hydrolase [Mycolicibacterium holsaticum DSM 44478 = JCM 12374]